MNERQFVGSSLSFVNDHSTFKNRDSFILTAAYNIYSSRATANHIEQTKQIETVQDKPFSARDNRNTVYCSKILLSFGRRILTSIV